MELPAGRGPAPPPGMLQLYRTRRAEDGNRLDQLLGLVLQTLRGRGAFLDQCSVLLRGLVHRADRRADLGHALALLGASALSSLPEAVGLVNLGRIPIPGLARNPRAGALALHCEPQSSTPCVTAGRSNCRSGNGQKKKPELLTLATPQLDFKS